MLITFFCAHLSTRMGSIEIKLNILLFCLVIVMDLAAHSANVSEGITTQQEKRRRRFVCSFPTKGRQEFPRANAIFMNAKSSDARFLVAPSAVRHRLHPKPSIVIGFDCETHDWLENTQRKGRIGPFGWYTSNDDVEFARIVQLGWAIATASRDAEVTSKGYFVQPKDFEIAERAKACHGITQEHALQQGRPLINVLEEFMHDVLQAVSKGGRLCAHQFEFDAGVIEQELRRCGLHDLEAEWRRIARCGYCTMNPEVGRWLKQNAGHDTGPETKQHTLGLTYTMRLLGLCPDTFQHRHHDAKNDAAMTRLIYTTLLELADGIPSQSSKKK